MLTLYPQLIIDALKTVRYPGTGKNIVEMGMVEDDLRIAGLHVSFSLLFDKPTNPFLKSLVKRRWLSPLTREGNLKPNQPPPSVGHGNPTSSPCPPARVG